MTPDLLRLRDELQQAAALDDPTERLLEVAAVIGEAVADLGLAPVVVGGLALAYWSGSEFLTADIDVVVRRIPALPERLDQLGFERLGREWILPGRGISFEAPGESLERDERAEAVELASGRRVLVLSPEDLLLWRLREWIHWRAASGFQQAAHLLVSEALDERRLGRRAAQEGLAPALATLRSLVAELRSGRTYETWELAEKAKALDAGRYDSG